jgi:hypothetical protein
MSETPNFANFYSTLETALSKKQIADLYGAIGWHVRKCTYVDYEITSDWAELIIEADSPILMHGAVADLPARAEEAVSPLRNANIGFVAECYGPPPDKPLVLELRSE